MNSRIFFITDSFPTISQIFISREILELEKRNVDICVYSIHRPKDMIHHDINRKLKADIIYTEDINSGKMMKMLCHISYLLTSPIRYLSAYKTSRVSDLPGLRYKFSQLPLICKKIEHFQPHHIHCHFGREGMLYGWLVSKILNIPFSVTLHGSDILIDPYKNLGIVLHDAEKVICVSENIRNCLIEKFSISTDKIHVIRCGVALDEFHFTPDLPESLKILSVARLHPVKGLNFLVEACEILSRRDVDFECTIYGEGPERDNLEHLINERKLGQYIKLPGAIANEKLADIYTKHSLVVLPSVSEGLPVVLMEAMASGRPIVASNVGGVSEIVEHDVNGLLVEPGNPAKLAAAIESMYKINGESLQQKAKQNRLKIERNFSIKKEIGKLSKLLSQK